MQHLTHYSLNTLCPINQSRKRRGKRAGNTLLNLFKENWFFLILTILLILFSSRFDLFYIQTGSMEPELPVGTIVVVDSRAEPKTGEIFAYRTGQMVVIHRIVSKDKGGYTFKGDANVSPDVSKVTDGQLLGKVRIKMMFLAPIVRWFIQSKSVSGS